MIKEQCISVTDLRKNASTYLGALKKPKYIFVNNKPKAVLMNIDDYEKLHEDLIFDTPVRPKDILDEYNKTYGKKIR